MRIRSDNSEYQKIIDRLYDVGQHHVLQFWPELENRDRVELMRQLAQVDLSLIAQLSEKYLQSARNVQFEGDLEPADYIALPETESEKAAFDQARTVGERLLSEGKVAAFLVAGGQGSRLGFKGPKGKFPVGPVSNKSLFQLHAEKIAALSNRYGAAIPWYIMTSETNHDETEMFLRDNNYFGLAAGDVMLFPQEMIPALDPDGKMILEAGNRIFRNPNGHGGSLSALKKSGALEDMNSRGIGYIFYFQVDNVLIRICDPVFLGFHASQNAEMSAKIVEKRDPEEKVGVIGHTGNRLGVIEYSDLPDDLKQARNADSSLRFRAGSIAIHIFNVEFVERLNQGGLQLPWHLAHKKIPHLNKNGTLIDPEAPNAYKFETFVFDALGDAAKAVLLEVDRREEFSPVKNADGEDSPVTARRDMIEQFCRWLEYAGITVPRDEAGNTKYCIEISSRFALDAQEFRQKAAGLTVSDNLLLE